MNTIERTPGHRIARRPLAAFFVLSYVLMWGFYLVVMLLVNPSTITPLAAVLLCIAGASTPTLAAVIVTGALEGRAGIGSLLRKYLVFRLPARVYLAALLPAALALVAAGIYQLAGGTAPGGTLSLGFLAALLSYLPNAIGEEGGWRGFALPRLLKGSGPVKASLILGILWSGWHLPLLLPTSQINGTDWLIYVLSSVAGFLALTLLLTWLTLAAPNSLVPVVLLHFAFNASQRLAGPQGLGLAPTLPLLVILAGLYVLVAAVVWGAGGLSAQRRRAVA